MLVLLFPLFLVTNPIKLTEYPLLVLLVIKILRILFFNSLIITIFVFAVGLLVS